MKSKSQIKFGETFAIIFIVFILLMFALLWYNNSNTKDIKRIQAEDERNRALNQYNFVVNSNLLRVSYYGDIDEEYDLVSLKVFENFTKGEDGKKFMNQKLSNSYVFIEIYDKDFNPIDNITLFNQTPRGEIESIDTFKTLFPVYDPITKNTHIGILGVRVYS
ncbi:MAG: hypothetical protein ACOC16_02965 [Nanoarchaeota archaeon]